MTMMNGTVLELINIVMGIVAVPVIIMGIQVILNRLTHGNKPQAMALVACGLGIVPLSIIMLALSVSRQFDLGYVVYCLSMYALVSYTYFHIANMSETSRRIRLLFAVGNQRLSLDAVKLLYSERDMTNVRLSRLAVLGQIVVREGICYSTKWNILALVGALLYMQSRIFGAPWSAIERWDKFPHEH
jgi:hypothetical protein